MAKGFTVKAKEPPKGKVAESAEEWDYDKAREMIRGKSLVFCLPGRGVSYAYLKNFVQLCIRFTDFEMNFTNKNKIMTIQELYAIGPAISILIDGYISENNIVSLRGTLVPATTINRSIASIPLIGDLLIGKKIGEGIFGVSFKVKGPQKKLETTVNPLKTLTPRFITRTLEKIKKN